MEFRKIDARTWSSRSGEADAVSSINENVSDRIDANHVGVVVVDVTLRRALRVVKPWLSWPDLCCSLLRFAARLV
jgi:hypothetical protein